VIDRGERGRWRAGGILLEDRRDQAAVNRIDHDCGSLVECSMCGELMGCDGARSPVCETCSSVARTGLAPPGRVCTADGCATVLSVYNKRSRCSLHDGVAA